MQPYGLPRNWNAYEDLGHWGRGYRPSTHSAALKRCHRRARRLVRLQVKALARLGVIRE